MASAHSHYDRKHQSRRSAGFTLIELAIVTVIMGFFMVGLIKAYELYMVDKKQREQEAKMDDMRGSLAGWIQDDKCVENDGTEHNEQWCADNGGGQYLHLANEGINGTAGDGQDAVRFPCPADPGAEPGDPNYATEVDNTAGPTGDSCDIGGTDIASINGGDAYRGAFPAKTVGLRPSKMIDPYGNKYSYVVSANVVGENDLNESNPQGNLSISDGGTTFDSRFALFSHGANGSKAYTKQGVELAETSGGSMESENVNDDLTFAIRQGQFGGNETYDDTFAASLVDDQDDEWWYATETGAQDITHRNPQDIIMGNKSSSDVGIGREPADNTQLHVEGDTQVDAGNITASDGHIKTGDAPDKDTNDGDITATASVRADENVEAGNNVEADENVLARGDKVDALNGSVFAKDDVTAETGDIDAEQGNVFAQDNIEARTGYITADAYIEAGNYSGSLSNGAIGAATDIFANRDITANRDMEAKHFFYSDVDSDGNVITQPDNNLPYCAAGYFLESNGSGYDCARLEDALFDISVDDLSECSNGQVLGFENGSLTCTEGTGGGGDGSNRGPIYEDWPDMIMCEDGPEFQMYYLKRKIVPTSKNPDWAIFYGEVGHNKPGWIAYDLDGSYSLALRADAGLAGCKGKSISQLKAEGHTYNFGAGSGSGGGSGTGNAIIMDQHIIDNEKWPDALVCGTGDDLRQMAYYKSFASKPSRRNTVYYLTLMKNKNKNLIYTQDSGDYKGCSNCTVRTGCTKNIADISDSRKMYFGGGSGGGGNVAGGSCEEGQVVTGINPDGSPQCDSVSGGGPNCARGTTYNPQTGACVR